MTDPLITDGLIPPAKEDTKDPFKPDANAYMSMEKQELCDILAKTITHNRAIEADTDQIRNQYEQELQRQETMFIEEKETLITQKDEEIRRLRRELRASKKLAQAAGAPRGNFNSQSVTTPVGTSSDAQPPKPGTSKITRSQSTKLAGLIGYWDVLFAS